MGWYLVYAGVFIVLHNCGVSLQYVFVVYMISIRILFAPLNFKFGSKFSNDGYLDTLIEYECQTFGRQVTPTWFLYVWYGILRVGQWKTFTLYWEQSHNC